MKEIEGFILYIDILGYSNLLKNYPDEGNVTNKKIKDLLDTFLKVYVNLDFRYCFGQKYDETKLLKRYFSENFLFVYESTKEEETDIRAEKIRAMKGIASQIQSQFLYNGLLTRGSITYGTIFYTDDIVFGYDLIKAVELEENHTEPSVLIDDNVLKILKNNEKSKHNPLFCVHGHSKPDFDDVIRGIEKYLEELNKNYFDINVYNKIEWVVNQMNTYFKDVIDKSNCKYKLQYSSIVELIKEQEGLNDE